MFCDLKFLIDKQSSSQNCNRQYHDNLKYQHKIEHKEPKKDNWHDIGQYYENLAEEVEQAASGGDIRFVYILAKQINCVQPYNRPFVEDTDK